MANGRTSAGGKSLKMTMRPKLDSQCADSGAIALISDAPHFVTALIFAEMKSSTADLVNGIRRLTRIRQNPFLFAADYAASRRHNTPLRPYQPVDAIAR